MYSIVYFMSVYQIENPPGDNVRAETYIDTLTPYYFKV